MSTMIKQDKKLRKQIVENQSTAGTLVCTAFRICSQWLK